MTVDFVTWSLAKLEPNWLQGSLVFADLPCPEELTTVAAASGGKQG